MKIRGATAADLPGILEVYHSVVEEDEGGPFPRPPVPTVLHHLLRTGTLVVADDGHGVAGYAGLLRRGPVAFLTDFFVQPRLQSRGLGQALLRATLPVEPLALATASSDDPRALALYIRAGMVPRWPVAMVRTLHLRPLDLGTADVEVVEAEAQDPELVAWDRDVGGRWRPEDHAYWAALGTALWFRRDGRPIGYAHVTKGESLRYPEAANLGPFGTREATDAVPCVAAALRWAAQRYSILQLFLPGPHPALAPLLRNGYRIIFMDTFASSSQAFAPDPTKYIPSGGSLF